MISSVAICFFVATNLGPMDCILHVTQPIYIDLQQMELRIGDAVYGQYYPVQYCTYYTQQTRIDCLLSEVIHKNSFE